MCPPSKYELPEKPFGVNAEGFIDQELVHALKSVTRIKILQVLMKQEASPNMMTQILGLDLGHIAYHARVLYKCGCIELTDTKKRRGATEHFYRAYPLALGGRHFWYAVPKTLQGSVLFASLRQLVQELALVTGNGGLDPNTSAIDSARLFLDDQGQRAAIELIKSASTQLIELDRQSRTRNPGRDAPLMPFEAGLALFPVTQPE